MPNFSSFSFAALANSVSVVALFKIASKVSIPSASETVSTGDGSDLSNFLLTNAVKAVLVVVIRSEVRVV